MPSDDALLEVIIKDFKDGMLTNIDSPDKLMTGFHEVKNARLDVEEGALVKRLQSTYYNETTLGTLPIKSGTRYYYGSDTKELIISYDTHLMKGNDSAGTFSNIAHTFTTNERFCFITYKDKLYCFNGVDTNQRYDGTNIRTMGCPIPTTSPSAAAGASGVLEAGDYKYLFTYLYDGYQESNANTTATTVSLTVSSQVNITSIPTSADPSVTARKVYRTLKNGAVYYYIATISNNTATTYTDNIAESTLVTQLETNHDIPPIFKMGVLHKSRIVGLRPNSCEIDFTSIIGYSSCPDIYDLVNNTFIINENDGEDVLAIEEVSEGVLCFKRSSTYLIRTSASNDPLLWTIEKVDNYGIVAPYSISKTPSGVIYLSLDKENQLDLRLTTGSSSKSLGMRVKDILDSINNLYYNEVVGKFSGGRYYLSFTDDIVGLSYNHKLLVLQFNDDFTKFGYTVDDTKLSCIIPCFGVGDFGQMYAGMSDDGRILRLETTSKDIVHKTKSDIDTGTLVRLVSGGTEEYPEVTLDSSAFAGLFSNTIINNMGTATINSYSTMADFIDNEGYLTSAILYIDAPVLVMAYWSMTFGENGCSALRLRTGETVAECSTATWSDWFTDNTGADISGVTPKKYIQYQISIASDDLPDADTKLYRNGFVVKISAGLGSVFETAVNFVLDTGAIHLGYQGQIKRIRQVVVEYESSGSTLNVFLAKNEDDFGLVAEAINTTTYPSIKTVVLPFTYFGEYLQLKLTEESLLPLKIKSIRILFSLLPKQAMRLLRN